MIFEEKIQKLYPNDFERVLTGITSLKEKYKTQAKPKKLSHKDAILICYADSFTEPQKPTLETLKTFMDKYLKGKINAVHLLPFFPYTSDDGFSVVDYYKVNADFGDWEHIENLETEYDLMFDAVVNHMSKSSEWFQKFLKQDKAYDNFFITSEFTPALKKVVRPRALPLLTPFHQNGKEINVWTTFSEDQVDLNYASPQVFLQVLDVLLFYVSKGARYIRLDAIAFIWKTIGTSCVHLPETHWVIQCYRKIINDIHPEVVLITETNVPHEENISYFGNGYNEAQMVYNFTLPPLLVHSLHQENVSTFVGWAKGLKLPSNEVCFFNFTASHDGVGVRPLQGIVSNEEVLKICERAKQNEGLVSYKNNEDGSQSPYEINCNYMDLLTSPKESDENRAQRFLLTQAVMLTFPGVPGIYYHSVVGSENNYKGVEKSGINRRINRQKLDLTQLEAELNKPETLRRKIYKTYSQLLEIRNGEECFNPFSETEYEQLSTSVFSIKRKSKQKELLAVFNFGKNSFELTIPKNGTHLLNAENFQQGETISIKGYDFVWILI